MKKSITKNSLKRALRTFVQTAAGYIVTNLALFLTGIDYTNSNVLANAGIGLAVSAISAGAAAVMNMEYTEEE